MAAAEEKVSPYLIRSILEKINNDIDEISRLIGEFDIKINKSNMEAIIALLRTLCPNIVEYNRLKTKPEEKIISQPGYKLPDVIETVHNTGTDSVSGFSQQCCLISILDFLRLNEIKGKTELTHVKSDWKIDKFRERNNITENKWPQKEDFDVLSEPNTIQSEVLVSLADEYELNLFLVQKSFNPQSQSMELFNSKLKPQAERMNVLIWNEPGHFELVLPDPSIKLTLAFPKFVKQSDINWQGKGKKIRKEIIKGPPIVPVQLTNEPLVPKELDYDIKSLLGKLRDDDRREKESLLLKKHLNQQKITNIGNLRDILSSNSDNNELIKCLQLLLNYINTEDVILQNKIDILEEAINPSSLAAKPAASAASSSSSLYSSLAKPILPSTSTSTSTSPSAATSANPINQEQIQKAFTDIERLTAELLSVTTAKKILKEENNTVDLVKIDKEISSLTQQLEDAKKITQILIQDDSKQSVKLTPQERLYFAKETNTRLNIRVGEIDKESISLRKAPDGESEKDKSLRELKKAQLKEEKKSIQAEYIVNNEIIKKNGQYGGSKILKDIYFVKYLKYKAKYIKLKNSV
jgi:hypothetical protein